MQYRAKTGDMLDAVCHDYYRGRPGATEEVLNANPGLSRLGPLLPEGMVIELPDLSPPEDTSRIVLWD